MFINNSSKCFKYFSLVINIEHCRYIPLVCEIFRIGYLINYLYVIFTIHALWSPVLDHSGGNISAFQSMSFVDPILSIWFLPLKCIVVPFFLVLSLSKSCIPNLVMNMNGFPLFRSLLAFIIDMILLYFYFRFLTSRTTSSLNNIIGRRVSPLFLWYIICLEYTVPCTIDDVEGFPLDWYSQTVLHTCLLFPFRFNQHHLLIPVISVPDSYNHPSVVSNANIHVPPSCAISLSLYILCVANAWMSVSELKSYTRKILWSSKYHSALHSLPSYPLSSSRCEKFISVNIFWVHVFHGYLTFQFSNINFPTHYFFVTRGVYVLQPFPFVHLFLDCAMLLIYM